MNTGSKMKKTLSALAISGTIFWGNQALALEPYITGQLGQSNIDAGDAIFADSLDDNDTYYGLGVGVHVTENLAFEIGYHDFGKIDAQYTELNPDNVFNGTESLKLDSIGIAAVGILPIDRNFSIFGKIGLDLWNATWKDSYTASYIDGIAQGSDSVKDDGADIFATMGAIFDISEAANLFIEYQMHSFNVKGKAYESIDGYYDVNLDIDADVLSVGATFSF